MVWKEKSPAYVIGGLSVSLLGALTLLGDIPDVAERFRQITGLNWQWWNLLLIVVGLSTATYGFWLHIRKTKPTDGDTGDMAERQYSIFLVPIVYSIIWYKKFVAWASAGKEGDPVRTARMIVFLICILSLYLIGAFLLLFSAWWILGQLLFYIQFGEFADLL